jgi:hypothetical protein
MSEEHRYSEAAESDDELPLPQGVRVAWELPMNQSLHLLLLGKYQVSWTSLPGSDAAKQSPEADAEVVMPIVDLFSV